VTPRELVDALSKVLESERAAIRKLDTEGVRAAATQKETLAKALGELTPADLATVAGSLPSLRAELRRNGVLLAHARKCVDDVLDLARPREGNVRRGSLRAAL